MEVDEEPTAEELIVIASPPAARHTPPEDGAEDVEMLEVGEEGDAGSESSSDSEDVIMKMIESGQARGDDGAGEDGDDAVDAEVSAPRLPPYPPRAPSVSMRLAVRGKEMIRTHDTTFSFHPQSDDSDDDDDLVVIGDGEDEEGEEGGDDGTASGSGGESDEDDENSADDEEASGSGSGEEDESSAEAEKGEFEEEADAPRRASAAGTSIPPAASDDAEEVDVEDIIESLTFSQRHEVDAAALKYVQQARNPNHPKSPNPQSDPVPLLTRARHRIYQLFDMDAHKERQKLQQKGGRDGRECSATCMQRSKTEKPPQRGSNVSPFCENVHHQRI